MEMGKLQISHLAYQLILSKKVIFKYKNGIKNQPTVIQGQPMISVPVTHFKV